MPDWTAYSTNLLFDWLQGQSSLWNRHGLVSHVPPAPGRRFEPGDPSPWRDFAGISKSGPGDPQPWRDIYDALRQINLERASPTDPTPWRDIYEALRHSRVSSSRPNFPA